MPTDTPRAGETWERVRDGRRVEVSHAERDEVVFGDRNGSQALCFVTAYIRWPNGRRTVRYVDARFLREFRRVSDGRET